MIKLKLFDINDLKITEEIITTGADVVIGHITSKEKDLELHNDTLVLSTTTHIVFINNNSLREVFKDIDFEEKHLEWNDFYETYVDEVYDILIDDLGFNKLMNPRYFEPLIEFVYDEVYDESIWS